MSTIVGDFDIKFTDNNKKWVFYKCHDRCNYNNYNKMFDISSNNEFAGDDSMKT